MLRNNIMPSVTEYTVAQVVNRIKGKKGKKGTVPLNAKESFIMKIINKYNGNTRMSRVLREVDMKNIKRSREERRRRRDKLERSIEKIFSIKPVSKKLYTIKENTRY